MFPRIRGAKNESKKEVKVIERQPKKRVTYRIVVITAAVVLRLQVVLFHRRRQRRRRRNEKKGSDFCRARQKKFVL